MLPSSMRVFVSYSWDSPEHKERVLHLAQRLRADGIEAWLDRFTPFPEEGWARWMVNQIEQAAFVLVVATANYEQRFMGNAPAGTGLGARWEGAIITQDLYESAVRNQKFLPVVLNRGDEAHIPKPLRQFTRFNASDASGYDALYRQITKQPQIIPAALGSIRVLPADNSRMAEFPPLAIPAIHDHAALRSSLPRLPYGFFGREEEIVRLSSALLPEARTWGALIDGPGGIGKTALAIRAAELTPAGQFQRIIFLSSKSREMTPDGEHPIEDFVVPAYLDMLNELARQIGQHELTKSDKKLRPALLQEALQSEQLLLILDNLESLPGQERERVFEFLSRLPRRCKAIVTSRHRTDIDARIIRLERLGKEAALEFIARLAEDRLILRRSTVAEREALYWGTGGNPLLIRWVAGRLGRNGCGGVGDALKLLANAPPSNDPLEFIFGGYAESFSPVEGKVLAVLSHFSLPVEAQFVAFVANLPFRIVQTMLEDFADRALVSSALDVSRFVLMPQVATYLRRAYADPITKTGLTLCRYVYQLIEENGRLNYARFASLENQWPVIAASLRLFLRGPNGRLQDVCVGLVNFLMHSERWDELLALELLAEQRAVAAQDWVNAGWRAYYAGYSTYRRGGEAKAVLAHSERAAKHWTASSAPPRDRAFAFQLRGHAHKLAGNHPAAISAYREAITMWRSVNPESDVVAAGLGNLANVYQMTGELEKAEHAFQEALLISRRLYHDEGIAAYTGNLAALALEQEKWGSAFQLAKEALAFATKTGRQELIATNSVRLATSLFYQNRGAEAAVQARRAVEIYERLNSPAVDRARKLLERCEKESIR